MIRGTTPTHTFNIPFDTSVIKEVRIIYAQDDIELFTKSTEDCELKDTNIIVTLTQQDTFKFDHKKCVQIQIRILTVYGEVLSSVIDKIGVSQCLSEEVLA